MVGYVLQRPAVGQTAAPSRALSLHRYQCEWFAVVCSKNARLRDAGEGFSSHGRVLPTALINCNR